MVLLAKSKIKVKYFLYVLFYSKFFSLLEGLHVSVHHLSHIVPEFACILPFEYVLQVSLTVCQTFPSGQGAINLIPQGFCFLNEKILIPYFLK